MAGDQALPVLRFAETARRLGEAARAAGLVVPGFRSPPRLGSAHRTIRRYPSGVVVSVVLAGRPFDEVATDMVEGVLVANRLVPEAALRYRTALLEAAGLAAAPPHALPSGEARMAERQTQAA